MDAFPLHQVILWTLASIWFEVQKHSKEIEVKKSVSGNQGKGRRGLNVPRQSTWQSFKSNRFPYPQYLLHSRTALVENVSTAKQLGLSFRLYICVNLHSCKTVAFKGLFENQGMASTYIYDHKPGNKGSHSWLTALVTGLQSREK